MFHQQQLYYIVNRKTWYGFRFLCLRISMYRSCCLLNSRLPHLSHNTCKSGRNNQEGIRYLNKLIEWIWYIFFFVPTWIHLQVGTFFFSSLNKFPIPGGSFVSSYLNIFKLRVTRVLPVDAPPWPNDQTVWCDGKWLFWVLKYPKSKRQVIWNKTPWRFI